jgi:2'-5' RNA ligase
MRLFAAVDLPAAVKVELDALRTPVPGARWVGHEQMHLTLFFIGETGRLPDIKAALDTVRAAPFRAAAGAADAAGAGRRRADRARLPGGRPRLQPAPDAGPP